jgi:sRNA-binding regulator protein Hfq
MMKKFLSIGLTGLLIFFADSAFVSAQTNAANNKTHVEKIKKSILKRGTGEKQRISVKMLNGTKMKGYINQAGEDSFTLTDSNTSQSTVLAYRDIAKVGSSGLSKGAKIALGVGIASAATLIVLYVAFQNAIRDN